MTKDREVHPNSLKWQPMQLANPSRASSTETFPRPRRNSAKSTSASIFRSKDLQHFKLDDRRQTDPDLVDQKTHFQVDLPLGIEKIDLTSYILFKWKNFTLFPLDMVKAYFSRNSAKLLWR